MINGNTGTTCIVYSSWIIVFIILIIERIDVNKIGISRLTIK